MQQGAIDTENAKFWNELCGSTLARLLGITDASPESLRRYDAAYLAFYPYLQRYVERERLHNKRVLEIGPGYGTLGQLLASAGCDYHGLDISEAPVAMMRHRLIALGLTNVEQRVLIGSALEIPHADASFAYVYAIGCLHHTGNLNKAVSEVYRVLVPGGKAIVMVYHRHSLFQLVRGSTVRLQALLSRGRIDAARQIRSLYDSNQRGEAAPHTDFVSLPEARRLFKDFMRVKIDMRNFGNIGMKGKILIPRELLLNNVARVLGLDLYITACK